MKNIRCERSNKKDREDELALFEALDLESGLAADVLLNNSVSVSKECYLNNSFSG
jgi:hypothetical protein